MNIEKILSSKELSICKKEKAYYQSVGVKKSILQIALEHNFVQKKEKPLNYNLELLRKYEILIINEDDEKIYIQRKELLGEKRVKELESHLGKEVIQKSIPVKEFNNKFQALLIADPNLIEKRIKQFNALDSDIEVLSLFEMILADAINSNASDIHINAYESFSWLRYRIDGIIEPKYIISHELSQRFSLIIKEKSNIDLINVQTPQSGAFFLVFEAQNIDIRLELAPASYGENIVLRILDKNKNLKTLKQLFSKDHPMYKYIFHFANLKNGFFLIVGPTGSGKTTTLNAIISQRDRLNEIIYTIEDPIEYKIDFITQFQVNETIGFDFLNAIKSIMRQDPDVIVIGEMRDKQSITTALKAAHSGHMVYSTLHTTNAYMALERIRDEGGDLFILAYSLSGVIAQRLIPKLCECKVISGDEKAEKYFNTQKIGAKKQGCVKCNFSGFNGRVLLVDMVFIPSDTKTRYRFYMALKNSSVMKVWDELTTFSYFESAKYLYEKNLCDFETLQKELLSLGYMYED